ncbi:MAG TPA: F0F1 ATP synthase subunit epsilon [Galbitalea sp.]|jgi:F-type H+-transporting ATPase subunit epsilon|nr:F0F1 ATP synthase subunit epsilon [Galbitalea sp.]
MAELGEIGPHELVVSVVSADKEVWTGAARQVIARTTVGEIGILAGHEPVLATLAEGEVRITTPSGEVISAHADDGFLSFDHNRLTVVAREAALI